MLYVVYVHGNRSCQDANKSTEKLYNIANIIQRTAAHTQVKLHVIKILLCLLYIFVLKKNNWIAGIIKCPNSCYFYMFRNLIRKIKYIPKKNAMLVNSCRNLLQHTRLNVNTRICNK